MTPSPQWPIELTRYTGRQVRKYRELQGLSAERLAEAVEAAGLPYTRAQVSNLEASRRTTITVGEVLVLAYVLQVAPLLLVFPIEEEEHVEILPGKTLGTWASAKWFTGDAPFPGEEGTLHHPVQVLREHDQTLGELHRERLILLAQTKFASDLRSRLTAVFGGRDPDGIDLDPLSADDGTDSLVRGKAQLAQLETDLLDRRERVARLEKDITSRRARMRRDGAIAPPLDEQFAYLDATAGEDGI